MHSVTLTSVQWDLSEAQGAIQAMEGAHTKKFTHIGKSFDMVAKRDREQEEVVKGLMASLGELSARVTKLAGDVTTKDTAIKTLEDQVLYLEGCIEEQHCSLCKFNVSMIGYHSRLSGIE